MILLFLSLACSQNSSSPPKPVVVNETGDVVVSEEDLHGTAPTVALGLPDFSATNSDGSARSNEHLLGSPSVLWFYPVAGTPG